MAHEFTKLRKLSERNKGPVQRVEDPLRGLLLASGPTTLQVCKSLAVEEGRSLAVEEGRGLAVEEGPGLALLQKGRGSHLEEQKASSFSSGVLLALQACSSLSGLKDMHYDCIPYLKSIYNYLFIVHKGKFCTYIN